MKTVERIVDGNSGLPFELTTVSRKGGKITVTLTPAFRLDLSHQGFVAVFPVVPDAPARQRSNGARRGPS